MSEVTKEMALSISDLQDSNYDHMVAAIYHDENERIWKEMQIAAGLPGTIQLSEEDVKNLEIFL